MSQPSQGWEGTKIAYAGDFLRVIGAAHYFFGPFSHSPDGRYTIGWSHGVYIEDDDRPDDEANPAGSFILVHTNQVLLHGWCRLPTLGRVADNGTALIVDQEVDETGSNLRVFDCGGNILFSQLYRHAVGQCGLTADGRYLAVHEATEIRETDRLNFIDITSQQTLWQQFLPYRAQPTRIEVLSSTNGVRVMYHDGVEAVYNFTGKLDTAHLRNTQLQSNDSHTLLALARQETAGLSTTSSQTHQTLKAREIFELLRRASQATGSAALRSEIMETTGELMETLALNEKAIEAYRKALELNPQAACKRRLNLLLRQQP